MEQSETEVSQKARVLPFINHAANYFPLMDIHATHFEPSRKTVFFAYRGSLPNEGKSLKGFLRGHAETVESGDSNECFVLRDRDGSEVASLVKAWVDETRHLNGYQPIPAQSWCS
jgi:hypothetical protein